MKCPKCEGLLAYVVTDTQKFWYQIREDNTVDFDREIDVKDVSWEPEVRCLKCNKEFGFTDDEREDDQVIITLKEDQ